MKRFIILSIAFGLLLLACGGGKESVKKEAPIKETKKEVISKESMRKEAPSTTKQVKKEVEKTAVQKQNMAKAVKKERIVKEKPPEVPVEKKTAVPTIKPEEREKARTVEAKPPLQIQKVEPVLKEKKEPICEIKIERLLKLQSALIEDIYFDPGEYQVPSLTFNSNYVATLVKVVKAMKGDKDIKVRLYGHSDASGDEETNLLLSEERCKTVASLILEMFKPEERKNVAKRIEIVPVGTKEPLMPGAGKSKSFVNRRVSIELTYDKARKGKCFADVAQVSVVRKKKIREFKPDVRKVKLSRIDELYKAGLKLFKKERYQEAIATFKELISLNPKHSLADNAQWWIGESYYFQGKFKEALDAYNKVFNLGDGNKSAYAQLRIGYCHLKLGNREKAIEEFGKVVKNYPAAREEVAKAKTVLKSIRGY